MGPDVHAVDGTPADCVNIAVAAVLGGRLPDLVISGINKGWNVGDDVTYSGTVGGALEGVLMGVPAVAVSMQRGAAYDFTHAAAAGASVAGEVLAHGLPPRVLLNVNVPQGLPTGWATTVQAARTHTTNVLRRDDPWGRPYFWLDEGRMEWAARARHRLRGRQGGPDLGDAAARRPDGACRDRRHRGAGRARVGPRSGLVVHQLALPGRAGALDEADHGLRFTFLLLECLADRQGRAIGPGRDRGVAACAWREKECRSYGPNRPSGPEHEARSSGAGATGLHVSRLAGICERPAESL